MKHACEFAHGRYKRGGDRTRVRGMVFSLHTIAVIPDHKAHSEKALRYSMGLKKIQRCYHTWKVPHLCCLTL